MLPGEEAHPENGHAHSLSHTFWCITLGPYFRKKNMHSILLCVLAKRNPMHNDSINCETKCRSKLKAGDKTDKNKLRQTQKIKKNTRTNEVQTRIKLVGTQAGL